MNQADIGIMGGTGFYDLATGLKEVKVETPYGPPSDKLVLGKIGRKKVAFLPRHSKSHDLPPHQINYRANIWALKSVGVNRIVTSHAVGSLQKEYRPGDFVVLDQFVDRTKGRVDTFYDGQIATHVSTAFPYCPQLRKLAIEEAKKLKLPLKEKGTVVVIQGPRFSTAAESAWFTQMGWEVVNMTEYPEVALAREKEICYCALAIVTDYDAGLVAGGEIEPVNFQAILRLFQKNINQAKKLILAMIKNWPPKTTCSCQQSLKNARFS
ncbi:MAG: S-methyl-5'-thioadenosine phosphorylase [Candidatus Marinimicrobia bacterium]|nr:S-methyl-5'-thioadenosine phosphorylase [Candidatus Neomarinimicrobiota bacterium]